jgi:GH18 family chitinase
LDFQLDRNKAKRKLYKPPQLTTHNIMMEKQKNLYSGKEHYEIVKRNIPTDYKDCAEEYKRNGRVYEQILNKILNKAFKEIRIKPSSPFFFRDRNGKKGGYLHPDLKVNDNIFIEVTTWGDSNMIFSKIMQGYLVKKENPKAKYYVFIADMDIENGWTWNEDKELWAKWSNIEGVIAVDGWFGFKGINSFIQTLKSINVK